MPLFEIQDSDRPMFVVAKDYGQAHCIWRKIIAKENGIKLVDVDPPLGIRFICEDSELVLNGNDWEKHCLK